MAMELKSYQPTKSGPLSEWSRRDKKATRFKVPAWVEKPVIDYGRLRQLQDSNASRTSHADFMSSYHTIFVNRKSQPRMPDRSITCSMQSQSRQENSSEALNISSKGSKDQSQGKAGEPAGGSSKFTHNIGDYLHRRHRSREPEVMRAQAIRTLRRVLRVLPFQRTAAENDQVLGALRQFSSLSSQVPANVLRELCVIATIDIYKQKDMTVFGHNGWHLILKGSVLPNSGHVTTASYDPGDAATPPEPLTVGECFGSLVELEDDEHNNRLLSVCTAEPVCEFVNISASIYTRVVEQLEQRDRTEKVNMLLDCSTFSLWSRQPLIKVANLLQWTRFPANTVLASEGCVAPFVAILRSGECHVSRQVNILHTLPSGKQEQRSRQVVMGRLGKHDSFGEISCVAMQPMTCSVVTATAVQLAIVDAKRLSELDTTTRQLLLQSSQPTFGHVGDTEVQDEYVQQEAGREWNSFKRAVLMNVINSRGIRPGYGKWAK